MVSKHSLLAPWHILTTRPLAQAQNWAKQLQSLGAQVSIQPMMRIEALDDTAATQAITDRVLAFDEYQKAIFISQNAVSFGGQWLDQYWPQLPVGVEYFAIGQATATALLQAHDDLSLQVASEAMNSENLLQHPQLQQLHGQKILIFRGLGGRDYLANELISRGAIVDYCELYRRCCPPAPQSLVEEFRHTSRCPVVAVHSGETLENLCSILVPDDLSWLQQHVILLPGERVAALARAHGFQTLAVARNASHDSMLEALNAMGSQ